MRRATILIGALLALAACSDEEPPSAPIDDQEVETAFDGAGNWICTAVALERTHSGWEVSTASTESCGGATVSNATIEVAAESLAVSLSFEEVSTTTLARIAQYEVLVTPPPTRGSPTLLNGDSAIVESGGMVWFATTDGSTISLRWFALPEVRSFAYPLWIRTQRFGTGFPLPEAAIDSAESTIRNEITLYLQNDVQERRRQLVDDSIAEALSAAVRWTYANT